jgi:hypothetical protein
MEYSKMSHFDKKYLTITSLTEETLIDSQEKKLLLYKNATNQRQETRTWRD